MLEVKELGHRKELAGCPKGGAQQATGAKAARAFCGKAGRPAVAAARLGYLAGRFPWLQGSACPGGTEAAAPGAGADGPAAERGGRPGAPCGGTATGPSGAPAMPPEAVARLGDLEEAASGRAAAFPCEVPRKD